jgi:hypothetical protein
VRTDRRRHGRGSPSRTRTVVALVASLVALVVTAAPAAAGATREWQRNNYGAEHERLTCREADASWTCSYDKVPTDGFSWDDRSGTFSGRNVTATWSCPEWFDSAVCDSVIAVYRGMATYTGGGQRPFTTLQEYVVTTSGGQDVLYVYWVDRFYCPWYRTFDEALAADYACVIA